MPTGTNWGSFFVLCLHHWMKHTASLFQTHWHQLRFLFLSCACTTGQNTAFTAPYLEAPTNAHSLSCACTFGQNAAFTVPSLQAPTEVLFLSLRPPWAVLSLRRSDCHWQWCSQTHGRSAPPVCWMLPLSPLALQPERNKLSNSGMKQ